MGVRGTNAPAGSSLAAGGRVWKAGGFGSNVTPVIDKLKSQFPLELKTWVVSLNYPAKAEVNLIDNSNSYVSSRNSGVATLKAELESYSSCAVRPMVLLIGYSQGADVVSTTLGSTMNATAKAQVKGAVAFGDPGYRPNQPVNSPGVNPGVIGMWPRADDVQNRLNGLKTYGWSLDSNSMASRQVLRIYCRSGDAPCQNNLLAGWGIHSDYSMYVGNAAAFLDNFIRWG
ncbi:MULTISPECIES: cutinase family protein [unclassified Microbacterium]|uniref:cutinase family protein n=1 Tax=unclassified Microbacterium TaxID=2609290 RepID=UPI0022AFA6C2|nr:MULTISPECIES: cutinase family protein [unclassified Microbacterium]